MCGSLRVLRDALVLAHAYGPIRASVQGRGRCGPACELVVNLQADQRALHPWELAFLLQPRVSLG